MKVTLLITLVLILAAACTHTRQKKKIVTAPTQDTYWNSVAEESVEGKIPVINLLDETYPHLSKQIVKDSKDPYLPMYWGESKNFDSNAKKIIVDEKVIEELQNQFNIKNDNMIVHAGVIHTYGYLFSTINTPYGYKRKRWIAPTLNKGLGLNSKAMSPETNEGGLFSNVTYFAGMVAFKNKSELSLMKNVSNEVFTFNYSKLKVDRLEEHLNSHVLVTSFVKFPNETGDENDYLLVYSIIDKTLNKELLITAFPVEEEFYNKQVAAENLGNSQKISLRYNGHIAQFNDGQTGMRKLIKNYQVK